MGRTIEFFRKPDGAVELLCDAWPSKIELTPQFLMTITGDSHLGDVVGIDWPFVIFRRSPSDVASYKLTGFHVGRCVFTGVYVGAQEGVPDAAVEV